MNYSSRAHIFQSYLLFTCIFALGHLAPLPKELRSNNLLRYNYDYDETWEYDPEAAFMYYHFDQMDGFASKSNDADDYPVEIDNFFTCVENGYYIHSDLVCDGFNDCPSGSDETQQLCPKKIFSPPVEETTTTTSTTTETTTTTTVASDDYDYEHCSPDEFACPSLPGLCLSRASLCDGVDDCPGGEDERHDSCSDHGVLEAKGATKTTVDIIHPQLTILHPEFDIIHPEFDVIETGADTLASTSKLKFATSSDAGIDHGGNTRMAKSGRQHRNDGMVRNSKAPSPYKLLYRIFEQSPLKKKLKVLNRLQRLALQSDEMRDDVIDLSELHSSAERSQQTKQFQTLLKRLSRNAVDLMNIKDLNINISIDIDDHLDNILTKTPST